MRFSCLAIMAVWLFASQQAVAALGLHDDIIVRRVQDGSGTNISFPNGGGPFVATIYEDNRIIWQPGHPTSPTSGINDVDLTYQGRQTPSNTKGTNLGGQ